MKKYSVLLLTSAAAGTAEGAARRYRSVAELIAAEREPATVVIDTSRLEPGYELEYYKNISMLRQSPVFCYAPLYFTHSVRSIDVLADGIFDDLKAVAREGEAILSRGERIKISSLRGSYKLRMLSYMYVRGGCELKPYCVPGSKWIYGYPIAAAVMEHDPAAGYRHWDGGGTQPYDSRIFDCAEMMKATEWIRSLQRCGYIEQTTVYDRIRLCPKCQTGYLNYIDICPDCGSLNIARKRMVHCFTCGCVAPEAEFRQGFSLSCPRCDAKLRHIGSDYDHPLESYQCEDCGSAFVDPDVRVSCLNCATKSPPSELAVNNFYGYRLSDRGAEAVRAGIISEEFMLFGDTNVVSMQIFCGIIKWLLSLRRRYPDEDFSLLRVKLSGLSDAEEVIGAADLRRVIAELDTRIKALVRETDVSVLDGDGIFWLILPRTALDGGRVLAGRLEDVGSLFEGPGAEKLRLSVKCLSVSAEDESLPPDELLKKFAKLA